MIVSTNVKMKTENVKYFSLWNISFIKEVVIINFKGCGWLLTDNKQRKFEN